MINPSHHITGTEMSETLADDLRAAKALITDPAKWTRNPKGRMPMCAYAAVQEAACGPNASQTSDRAMEAERFLARFLPEPFAGARDCIEFNDHPDTTHADIMALFDRAINAAMISSAETRRTE